MRHCTRQTLTQLACDFKENPIPPSLTKVRSLADVPASPQPQTALPETALSRLRTERCVLARTIFRANLPRCDHKSALARTYPHNRDADLIRINKRKTLPFEPGRYDESIRFCNVVRASTHPTGLLRSFEHCPEPNQITGRDDGHLLRPMTTIRDSPSPKRPGIV